MQKWGRRTEDQEWFVRLNRTEVWQHNIIWVTFLLLVLTGMMSLIPTSWVTGMFGEYTAVVYRWRRYLHFFFAFWLFVGCVWHICYLAFTDVGRQVFWDILLKPHDLVQMKENVQYMLGMRPEKPLFDRYDYKEKLEYLFGCIGTTVIFITGSIMTFEYLFPKFVVEVAATFHLMEATLASFAISIWHFYAVHLKPGKFPQDTSWIDGKMTMHHLQEEHPVYYEQIMKERDTQKRRQREEPKYLLADENDEIDIQSNVSEVTKTSEKEVTKTSEKEVTKTSEDERTQISDEEDEEESREEKDL